MEDLPDGLLVVDIVREEVAIKEAKQAGIPVVAIVDSNSDPSLVDYPIPANDDAVGSIKFIVSFLADAITEGRKAGQKKTEKKTKPKEKSGK
jgi:small subunit ribosomal protein S2